MTVADFIKMMQTMPQDLPVALADWQEEWSIPNERVAERAEVVDSKRYYCASTEKPVVGRVVVIGLRRSNHAAS